MTKVCSKCKQEKDLEEFSIHNSKTGYIRPECKECESKIKKERYLKKIGRPLKTIFRTDKERFKDGLRVCSICGIAKEEREFGYHNKSLGLKRPECKSCSNSKQRQYYKDNIEQVKNRCKWSKIKCNYGLSKEQFSKMIKQQDNKCSICGEEFTKTPHVDHNHNTGKIRGILCHKCNTGLGLFNENITLLNKAIDYVKIHNT